MVSQMTRGTEIPSHRRVQGVGEWVKAFAPEERDDEYEALDLETERLEARVGVTGDVGVSGAALPAREEEERVETILEQGWETNWIEAVKDKTGQAAGVEDEEEEDEAELSWMPEMAGVE